MNLNVLVIGFAATAAILFVLIVCIIIYFNRREQRMLNRIQQMLDDAVDGNFQDTYLDETKISSVENSMWRYLCDNQVSREKLSGEKERVQALISDISHQTVTPIANIMLYSQLLEEQQGCEELTVIREQAEKLEFLVESLVRLSRLETGIIRVNVHRQSIAPVLSAVGKQFHAKAEKKNIRLEIENTDEKAVFDFQWTVEAVANIVDNAIKYTPRGGIIRIDVKPYSFFTRIDVTDNGIGISEAEQASIFTRFYRSELAREEKGLGIGLYLAREIMRAQNGYMKLISREGVGSTFSLFLLKEEMSQK